MKREYAIIHHATVTSHLTDAAADWKNGLQEAVLGPGGWREALDETIAALKDNDIDDAALPGDVNVLIHASFVAVELDRPQYVAAAKERLANLVARTRPPRYVAPVATRESSCRQ